MEEINVNYCKLFYFFGFFFVAELAPILKSW